MGLFGPRQPPPVVEGPPVPRFFDGLVFKHAPSLLLWGMLAAVAVAVNLFVYAWTQLTLGPFDAPSASEQVTFGGYLVVWGLVFASVSTALLHGAKNHPRKMLMPWMLLGAVAVIHLLLGFPVLLAGVNDGGGGRVPMVLWLNPLTYVVALPTLLTLARASNWPFFLPKVAGVLLAAAGVVALYVWATGH